MKTRVKKIQEEALGPLSPREFWLSARVRRVEHGGVSLENGVGPCQRRPPTGIRTERGQARRPAGRSRSPDDARNDDRPHLSDEFPPKPFHRTGLDRLGQRRTELLRKGVRGLLVAAEG